MFVINPDPYSLPCYRIGPFSTGDIGTNNTLDESDLIEEYFRLRFKNRNYYYTINGRTAINHALQQLDLEREDIVTVFTTSGNFYISGCVTREIDKFCKWSRKIESRTKAILVNHEFGYPYQDLMSLKDYGLPIIEDCASSFFTANPEKTIGEIGDYVVYSFPKMFPLQIGGLLIADFPDDLAKADFLDSSTLRYIKNVLSHSIVQKDEIVERRNSNYDFLKEKFESLGIQERFTLHDGVVPGVFMFRTDERDINLLKLKEYYYAHGIQCSVFYGEEAFFIPVHQGLRDLDLLYFVEVFKSFLNSEK